MNVNIKKTVQHLRLHLVGCIPIEYNITREQKCIVFNIDAIPILAKGQMDGLVNAAPSVEPDYLGEFYIGILEPFGVITFGQHWYRF